MASAGVGTEMMYASKPGSRRNTSNDPAIISSRATIYQHRSEVDAAGEGGSGRGSNLERSEFRLLEGKHSLTFGPT